MWCDRLKLRNQMKSAMMKKKTSRWQNDHVLYEGFVAWKTPNSTKHPKNG